MRMFFAIEFENQIKDYLSGLQGEIRSCCKAGNFTLKENFHLTLRFIGEQDRNQAEQLKSVLKKTAEGLRGFELRFGRLGKFDKGNRKIIWLGLQKSRDLEYLYASLADNLLEFGYEKENRPFSPHITLAREVRWDDSKDTGSILNIEDPAVIRVKTISLMESKRLDGRLCYMPSAREALN